MGGSARRPGRITFAGRDIWHGDAVGSGLEGLAERDLILAKIGPFVAILTENTSV